MKSQTQVTKVNCSIEIPQYLNPEYLLLRWEVGQLLSGARAGAMSATLRGMVIWGGCWEGHTLTSNKHFTIRSSCVSPLDDQSRQKEHSAESNDLHNPSTLIAYSKAMQLPRPLQELFCFLFYQVLVIKDKRWWFQMTVWICSFWKGIKYKDISPICPCPLPF